MLERLQQMDSTKRQSLINAAIDEFSQYSYQKASTNSIVKKAGISKGLLFHYFTDKKDLYHTTLQFVVHTLFEKVSSAINWEEQDLLERIKQLILAKIVVWKEYPHMFDFAIMVVQNEDTSDAMQFYQDQGINLEELMGKMYSHNVDFSLFKNQEHIQNSIEITQWVLEGISQKYTKAYNPAEKPVEPATNPAGQADGNKSAQNPAATDANRLPDIDTYLATMIAEINTYMNLLKELLYKK